MTLQGLSAFCDHNPGGVQLIEYAPAEWVNKNTYEQIITDTWNWQITIEFETGDWLTMPLLNNQRIWQEQPVRGPQGPHYNQIVSGIVRNLRPDVSGELNLMEEHCFLVKLQDRNGRPWILGTLNTPFYFSAEATTGEDRSGLNSYRIRFVSETPRRAYGYVPKA